MEVVTGDRNTDLRLLEPGVWDAVIDTCGYTPAEVRLSYNALRGCGRYLFVSSISAYATTHQVPVRETDPLASFEAIAPDNRDLQHYGPQKAACEAEVSRVFTVRCLQLFVDLRPKKLRVEVSNWRLLLERLRAEDIEFFVADTQSLTPADSTLELRPVWRHRGGFYARTGHPLAERPCTVKEMWAYGVAAIQVPHGVLAALATRLDLPPGQIPGFALQCDDMRLLRTVALATDTVLGATDVAVKADLESGRLQPLIVTDLPPLFSAMGVVSLRGRSPSPMARLAIEFILEVARDPHAQQ